MLLPTGNSLRTLSPRQSPSPPPDHGSTKTRVIVIVVVSVAIVASILVLSYIILKFLRSRHENPKYLPTSYLRNRWRRWSPRGLTMGKGGYSTRLQDNSSVPTLHLRDASRSARNSHMSLAPSHVQGQVGNHETEADAGVNRNTSVRSVMTLPAYSHSVRENERVLGREGERAGIDVVIEAPETAEEEEDRREEEMSSLYQIREQRRREIADREERRRQRREARERGDYATLSRLRQEALEAAGTTDTFGSSVMIAEHQSRSQERRVSSVSYADLGVARHDGTRIRSDSIDSDNRPLLDSAASIGTTRQSIGDSLAAHRRGRSYSSAMSTLSVSDVSDAEADMPPFGRSGSDFEVVSLNAGHSRNASRTHTPLGGHSRNSSSTRPATSNIDTADLGQTRIPLADPPAYDGEGFEDAPPYQSPVERRAPPTTLSGSRQTQPSEREPALSMSQSSAPILPEISRLPSIRIGEATPIEPRGPVDFSTIS